MASTTPSGSGRPVADSPEYKGDLFLIEVPNPNKAGEMILHAANTNINKHQEHIDRMLEHGNYNFAERRIKAAA